MAKLIALAVIAAGVIAPDAPEIPVGQTFEATGTVADTLVAEGQAKPEAPTTAAKGKSVQVRVLTACALGAANDVVPLSSTDAKAAVAQGVADDSKEAVTYALSLPQNQRRT